MVLSAASQHLLRGSRIGARGGSCSSGGVDLYTPLPMGSRRRRSERNSKLSLGGSIDLVKQESGIAVLTVNNPARMNAFSGSMMVELEKRMSQLEEWTEGKARTP
ncbi:unnamed protein product, partial [Coregonus sp. 'balchen']